MPGNFVRDFSSLDIIYFAILKTSSPSRIPMANLGPIPVTLVRRSKASLVSICLKPYKIAASSLKTSLMLMKTSSFS